MNKMIVCIVLSIMLIVAPLSLSSLQANQDTSINIIVFMEDSPLRETISKISLASDITRDERIKIVTNKLMSYRAPNVNSVKQFLDDRADTVIQHWVVPAFTATIPLSSLDTLAWIDGVKVIIENSPVHLIEPIEIACGSEPLPPPNISTQLKLLNVPYLWSKGYNGRGRLVCSFDTGVEKDHPALSSKWRGNHAHVPTSAAWFSNVPLDTIPIDRNGHGTHTMGLLVGSVNDTLFGVAPGAEWITAGVIDVGRPHAVISDILNAFEWSLNPDGDTSTTNDVPDVISNSWGVPKGFFTPCDETFNTAIDNVEAAGIVVVFAAGNEGPNPQTLRSPADRASTSINCFAVGAVSNSKTIANFSSRGPSSCDTTQIKPEVVAPGVFVRSSYKGGGYAYMSGTSMACPYIAGLVVLYRQYDPDASVEEIKYAIINSCNDLGTPGEDNAYGYGLPDASRLLDTPTDTINDDTLIEEFSYTLYQNYPNPFRLNTYIEFSLPHKGEVSLRVFNILGQEVQTLRKSYLPAGRYMNEWKMILPNKRFAAGVYFYVLTWNGRLQVKKMIALN